MRARRHPSPATPWLGLQAGYTPLRTVHLSFVPDEEIGGADGMAKFLETSLFEEKLNVGIALDEGIANEGACSSGIVCVSLTPFLFSVPRPQGHNPYSQYEPPSIDHHHHRGRLHLLLRGAHAPLDPRQGHGQHGPRITVRGFRACARALKRIAA